MGGLRIILPLVKYIIKFLLTLRNKLILITILNICTLTQILQLVCACGFSIVRTADD